MMLNNEDLIHFLIEKGARYFEQKKKKICMCVFVCMCCVCLLGLWDVYFSVSIV